MRCPQFTDLLFVRLAQEAHSALQVAGEHHLLQLLQSRSLDPLLDLSLGVAACLLLPSYYVTPQVGHGFVLIAFTIVVLGGMGSFVGALLGGLIIGVVEALGGLFFGESLGQLGIFLIFILVLVFRPTGLLGHKV